MIYCGDFIFTQATYENPKLPPKCPAPYYLRTTIEKGGITIVSSV